MIQPFGGRRAARASKVVGKPFDPTIWNEMCGGEYYCKLNSQIINNTGTLVHMNIERLINNQKLPQWSLPEVQGHFGRIQPLLQNISNVTCSEQILYSPTLGIAGTTDTIADYNGIRSIIDYKTSTKPKTDFDNNSYYLQATLYSRLWEEMTGEKIKNIAILMSVSGGQYKAFLKQTDEFDRKLDDALTRFEGLR